MNGEPATKQDLIEVKNELTELMRDVETRLLQAFYGFAETNNKCLNIPPTM